MIGNYDKKTFNFHHNLKGNLDLKKTRSSGLFSLHFNHIFYNNVAFTRTDQMNPLLWKFFRKTPCFFICAAINLASIIFCTSKFKSINAVGMSKLMNNKGLDWWTKNVSFLYYQTFKPHQYECSLTKMQLRN